MPIAATADRLRDLDEDGGFEVAPGANGGWVPLDRVERAGHLDGWLAAFTATHGRRAVAGSTVGGELAGAVVGPAVAAIVLDGRCPDPAVDNLAVWPDEEGYLRRRAVLGRRLAVLPGDPAAGQPHSEVVADEPALDEWWARRTAASLAPLLAAVRARAPFGVRGLWGGASDEVTRTAIRVAQLAGRAPDVAWARALRLVDALARHAPVALTRARPFPVSHPGGVRLFQVCGVCCLYHRSALGEGYCTTCPLRDDESRHRLLHDHVVEISTV